MSMQFDESPYTLRRGRLDFQRDAQRATNDYARFVSQQRFNRGYESMLKRFRQQRDVLPNSFNARGLMNSGIWRNSLQRFAEGQADAVNDAMASQRETERGFDLRDSQINDAWNVGVVDLEAEKQARIRQLAAELAAAKQYMG